MFFYQKTATCFDGSFPSLNKTQQEKSIVGGREGLAVVTKVDAQNHPKTDRIHGKRNSLNSKKHPFIKEWELHEILTVSCTITQLKKESEKSLDLPFC